MSISPLSLSIYIYIYIYIHCFQNISLFLYVFIFEPYLYPTGRERNESWRSTNEHHQGKHKTTPVVPMTSDGIQIYTYIYIYIPARRQTNLEKKH